MKIDVYLKERSKRVDEALERFLAAGADRVEPRLLEAMRYSLLSSGKRIRPILVLAAGEAVGEGSDRLLAAACAVEMIHTYSLIHDDLPAMDDDPVRRGRPSNHVVFGEALAILAGDALLTEAFAWLGEQGLRDGLAAGRVLAAIGELGAAAGAAGMVGGQVADLLAEGTGADLARVESIHRRKTAALIRASVRIGGLLGGGDEPALDRLGRYGDTVGLAFQVADDLLDALGRTAETGKPPRRDEERAKSTVPAALGIDRSRKRLGELCASGIAALEGFDSRADPLREIARFLETRVR